MNQKFILPLLSVLSLLVSTITCASDPLPDQGNVEAIHDLNQLAPVKATVDGKRIASVESDNVCFVTITMESHKKYRFSFLDWPKQGDMDDAGYSTYVLKDTENKPHVFRTDPIKGEKILTIVQNLIEDCTKAENPQALQVQPES